MWYVIQTMTGHEEDLVRMIRKVLPGEVYQDCFVAYYERIWRKQQQSQVHVERLFPGYVFIVAEEPNEVYQHLKHVPAMSRLMSDGMFTFLPLEEGEEAFLQNMLDEYHIVRLSLVEKDSRSRVKRVIGPLRFYLEQVARWQYKKRYALVRLKLLGVEKMACLGIILLEDIRQEIAYGKVEAPLAMPEIYRLGMRGVDQEDPELSEKQEMFAVGDHVTVASGVLAGMTGVVWKVKKGALEIGIRLFGQDMSVQVPSKDVCRHVAEG